jgi:hypothetical protein
MNRVSIFASLVLLFVSSVGYGQINCYDSSLNLSGVSSVVDSLELKACQIDGGMPGAVSSNFKVHSVVEYTLHKFKEQENIDRFKANTIDSLRATNPFGFIFWWSPGEDDALFGRCDLDFSYPMDDDYQNCFTQVRSAIIESQLEQFMSAQIATGGFRGKNYVALEFEILGLLESKTRAIRECCSSPFAKSEGECAPCPGDQESLTDLKRLAYLGELGTLVPVELPSDIPVTFQISQESKSQNGFINLVGGSLKLGGVEIDLEEEYSNFIGLGDTICDFPAYFTTDETLCDLAIDNWDTGDRTIINLSSTDSELVLEISEYTSSNCYLFGDYLIDNYSDFFGFLIADPFGRGSSEEDADEIVTDPMKRNCFYSPSGNLLFKQDYSTSNALPLTKLKVAKATHNYPLNALYEFEFNSNSYISCRRKSDENYFLGYFDKVTMGNLKELNRKINTTNLKDTRFLNPGGTNDWAIVKEAEICWVSAYDYHGCFSGRQLCQWDATATTESEKGPGKEVIFGPNALCGEYAPKPETVCCNLGARYIRDIHTNPRLSQSQKDLLNTGDGIQALFEIGTIICDIGTEYFGDYGEGTWEDTPDALKMYFENGILKVGESGCDTCTLDQLLQEFKDYKVRLDSRTFGWDFTNNTDWKGMLALLLAYENADFALLYPYQRFIAIKTLSNYLDCQFLTTDPCYEIDEVNEMVIVKLMKHQNSRMSDNSGGSESCEFASLLMSDQDLLRKLFNGFSDVSYREGKNDEYYDLLIEMMKLISTTECARIEQMTQQTITEVLNIGYFASPSPALLNSYCPVEITGDCFSEMTITRPYPFPITHNGGPPLVYLCTYSDPFGFGYDGVTIQLRGPLDYVYVNVLTDEYGGILKKGQHFVPAFLLCYLKNYNENQAYREKITILINTAIITVSVATLPVSPLFQLVTAIDVAGTVVFSAVNNQIETGTFKDQFKGANAEQDYHEFINNYRRVEHVFNATMIGGAVVEISYSAMRGLSRSMSKARVCNLISLASGVFSKLSLHSFSDTIAVMAYVLTPPLVELRSADLVHCLLYEVDGYFPVVQGNG